jgi:hypothetical protein
MMLLDLSSPTNSQDIVSWSCDKIQKTVTDITMITALFCDIVHYLPIIPQFYK